MTGVARADESWLARAQELDAQDPLAAFRDRFVDAQGVVAYLDGNSLGRPPEVTAQRLAEFVRGPWGTGLIRGWTDEGGAGDDSWMSWPASTGDLLGSAVLGAAPGQTVVADSTTVMLYKLARAAVDHQLAASGAAAGRAPGATAGPAPGATAGPASGAAAGRASGGTGGRAPGAAAGWAPGGAAGRASGGGPGRTEIVLDTDNFPTDRYVLEGIAAERGLTLRWVETDPASGVQPEDVAAVVGPRTALVVFSHVAYRSGFLADAAAITRLVHDAGALVLWDLCHSAGSVPVKLDAWGVDLAVGCTYKYLNGGPGSPAFGYVRADLRERLHQPIWGWMGRKDVFEMGPGYEPHPGIRGFLSGTPPILGMVPLRVALEMVAEAGIDAIRAKSVLLTELTLELVDAWLAEHGVAVASPRDSARRGGHVTIRRPDFREVNDELWRRGVIPDFRAPDGIRLGLSPLSTSFTEVYRAMEVIRDVVT